MAVELDHLLWAAPDLDAGSAAFARLTGLAPAVGGSHPGFGTRNSLASLGRGRYIEIIAPDPAQTLADAGAAGERAARIAAMAHPGLITFAVRTTDLAGFATAAEAAGAGATGPVAMGRTRPDGVRLDWACLYVSHPVYADAIPFAIDWQGSPHPSGSTPEGCTLTDFAVLHPEPDPLRAIFDRIGIDVPVRRAARPGFLAVLATPAGDLTLLGA